MADHEHSDDELPQIPDNVDELLARLIPNPDAVDLDAMRRLGQVAAGIYQGALDELEDRAVAGTVTFNTLAALFISTSNDDDYDDEDDE